MWIRKILDANQAHKLSSDDWEHGGKFEKYEGKTLIAAYDATKAVRYFFEKLRSKFICWLLQWKSLTSYKKTIRRALART